jgi:hypothetical protein
MSPALLEIKGYESVKIDVSPLTYSFAIGGHIPPRVCAIKTLIRIFHETSLEIKRAQVNSRSIDLTLADDSLLTANIINTDASFIPEHLRTFGHDPQGREPVEGECIKKWGVIRESGGEVTMYIKQKGENGCVQCNDYGIPTHVLTSYWDKPKHIRVLGSPLHMKMDGWWYVDSKELKSYKVPNRFTFEDARILYAGDPHAKNSYDPGW